MNSRIVSAEYLTSAYSQNDLPEISVPEIAFAGRSNAGKSSLLNALVGQKSLARTSKTPGRTQAINFFDVSLLSAPFDNESEETRLECRFVDLPGYGYAEVPKREKKRWAKTLEHYLQTREALRAVLVLVDGRRKIQDEEIWFLQLSSDVHLSFVMTKTDKLSRSEVELQRRAWAKTLGISLEQIPVVSVLGKKKQGLDNLINLLADSVREETLA